MQPITTATGVTRVAEELASSGGFGTFKNALDEVGKLVKWHEDLPMTAGPTSVSYEEGSIVLHSKLSGGFLADARMRIDAVHRSLGVSVRDWDAKASASAVGSVAAEVRAPRAPRPAVDVTDAATARAELLDLVRQPLASIHRDDWSHALDLVRGAKAAGVDIGISESLPGASSADSVLQQLATGSGIGESAQRYAMNWRLELGGGFAIPEEIALRDGQLGAQFIRRSDVPAFLDDSAWQHTTFHGANSTETFDRFVELGPQVGKNKRSAWGQGIYTAATPGGWGNDTMEIAIRSRNPFVSPHSHTDFHASIDALWKRQHPGEKMPARSASLIRQTLLDAGYDGLVVRRSPGQGGDWLIGLTDDQMRIVVQDAAGVADVRPPAPSTIDLPETAV